METIYTEHVCPFSVTDNSPNKILRVCKSQRKKKNQVEKEKEKKSAKYRNK